MVCLHQRSELIAYLHILLVSKMLRKISKGESIQRNFKVKGLLLDKVCSTMHCSLSVEMKHDAKVRLNVHLSDPEGGFMTPELLCTHIRTLANV